MADKQYQCYQTNNHSKQSFFTIENGQDIIACSYLSLSNIHLLAVPNRENLQLLGFYCDKDIFVFKGENLQKLQTDLIQWNVSKISCYDPKIHKQPSTKETNNPIVTDINIRSMFDDWKNTSGV